MSPLIFFSLFSFLSLVNAIPFPTMNHTGNVFNFVPGLGACGYKNTTADVVASVSQNVYTTFPGASWNPNHNPICGKMAYIMSPNGKALIAQVVDFFTESGRDHDIGLSPVAFEFFAPLSEGLVRDAKWDILV